MLTLVCLFFAANSHLLNVVISSGCGRTFVVLRAHSAALPCSWSTSRGKRKYANYGTAAQTILKSDWSDNAVNRRRLWCLRETGSYTVKLTKVHLTHPRLLFVCSKPFFISCSAFPFHCQEEPHRSQFFYGDLIFHQPDSWNLPSFFPPRPLSLFFL